MNDFRKLEVYSEARSLNKQIYRVSGQLPNSEQYGLISQMRRASTSIMANLVEGAGRNNRKEFRHFVGIASGSVYELEALLDACTDLEYVDLTEGNSLLRKHIHPVQRMLHRLRESLN